MYIYIYIFIHIYCIHNCGGHHLVPPINLFLLGLRSTAVLETYMASFVMGSDARELRKDAVTSRATMLRKLEEVPCGQDGHAGRT